MARRDRFQGWIPAMIATLGIVGGCSHTQERPKEHVSALLLDSGPQPKVNRRQAADVHVAMGRTHEEQGQLEEARASYLAALAKDPKRADAELRLAILDDRKGDATGADHHFASALKLAPKDPEILCDRGYCLYLRRRWSDAETVLKQAIALDKGHARSHSNLALVYARRGDEAAALVEFARAGCDPSDARTNLGLVLAMEGRFVEAKREYDLALAAKPGSTQAREGLHAATVALSGKASETRMLATSGGSKTGIDPAVQRTSAVPGQ